MFRLARNVGNAATLNGVRGLHASTHLQKKLKKQKTGFGQNQKESLGNEDDHEELQDLVYPPRPRKSKPFTEKQLNERALQAKNWQRYNIREEHKFFSRMCTLAKSRDAALDELQRLNMQLYVQAITVDETRWPLNFPIPTDTPPMSKYSTTIELTPNK
eukprot:m.26557 g.26557  ORF g.26557 m.26557 type:complete len:159 (-) comp15442_c1_seq1:67-543(-)